MKLLKPRKSLSPEEFLRVIVKRNIKLTPVLSKHEPTFWQAGFRRIGGDGYMNVVLEHEFAEGSTPTEAVEKLLAGEVARPKQAYHVAEKAARAK